MAGSVSNSKTPRPYNYSTRAKYERALTRFQKRRSVADSKADASFMKKLGATGGKGGGQKHRPAGTPRGGQFY